MLRLRLLFPAAVIFAALATLAHSQTTPSRFDVVSVKLNPNGGRDMGNFPRQFRFLADGRNFEMIEGAVVELIRYAHPTDGRDVRGIPDWVIAERYDVRARANRPATIEQRRELIGALLSERFKFKFRYETVDQPVYRLVRARSDGRINPNLKKTPIDCAAQRALRARGELPATPPPPGAQVCSVGYGGGSIAARGIPMAELARLISEDAERVVLDDTNLEGDYEFTLTWKPPQVLVLDPQVDRPSLTVALEEQLGLRLQPDRAPVRLVHVDQIERPAAD